jgi:hypothetical protein
MPTVKNKTFQFDIFILLLNRTIHQPFRLTVLIVSYKWTIWASVLEKV